MLEFGVLIFGGLTGNLVLSIGWILVKSYGYLNPSYENLSVAVLIIISIVRKLLRSTGVN